MYLFLKLSSTSLRNDYDLSLFLVASSLKEVCALCFLELLQVTQHPPHLSCCC